jgi:glucose/arabinose dehydrogenase
MALKHLFGLASVVLTAKAQSSSTAAPCPSSIAPAHGAPSVAPGFRVQVVANNLRDPRSLQFDSAGGLLVVEQGHGISRLTLTGDGACVRQTGATQSVVENDKVSYYKYGYDTFQDGQLLTATSLAMASLSHRMVAPSMAHLTVTSMPGRTMLRKAESREAQ